MKCFLLRICMCVCYVYVLRLHERVHITYTRLLDKPLREAPRRSQSRYQCIDKLVRSERSRRKRVRSRRRRSREGKKKKNRQVVGRIIYTEIVFADDGVSKRSKKRTLFAFTATFGKVHIHIYAGHISRFHSLFSLSKSREEEASSRSLARGWNFLADKSAINTRKLPGSLRFPFPPKSLNLSSLSSPPSPASRINACF